jgi:hypothetical protein
MKILTHTVVLAALIAAMILVAGSITSCAQLMRFEGIAAGQTAKGVNAYCKNTDEAFRERFRTRVNEEAKPHSIAVTCGTP